MSDDQPTLPRRSPRLQHFAPEYRANPNIRCVDKRRKPKPYIQVRPRPFKPILSIGLFFFALFVLLILKDHLPLLIELSKPGPALGPGVVVFPNAPLPPHYTSSTTIDLDSLGNAPIQPFPAWKFDHPGTTTVDIQRRMNDFFKQLDERVN